MEFIKNKIFVVTVLVILLNVVFLCGCQETQKAAEAEKKADIVLKSDVVELSDSSFKKNTKMVYDEASDERYEVVKNVEVSFRFRNIAERDIKIKAECEFYDKNNDLIGIKQAAKEITLPKGYEERATNTLTNKVVYVGDKANKVSKVVIIAEETT